MRRRVRELHPHCANLALHSNGISVAGATRTFQTPDGRTVTSGPVQPWTWQLAELFKVEKGKIHEIEALLHRVPYGMNSGWSTWSQGMSDVARDVTME